MLKKPTKTQNSKEAKPYKFNQSQIKWLEALESGEYEQGIGQLCEIVRDKNREVKQYKYCCLGVASELFCSNKDVVISDRYARYCNKSDFAPAKVQEKLKLNDGEGSISEEDNLYNGSSLAELNDDGFTFKKIAKFIRNNPMSVFKS